MVFCHFERKKCSGTVFSNPNAFLRSRGVFLAKWLNHNIWHDILRWPPNSSWLAVVCRKHQYKADVYIYIYMYSLIEGNNCRLSASPSQHDLGKVPVEGTQCHQTRWYMSGYVGSMPNKVLIQTATLYHWIQNPLTELGLVFHEEKNLFRWVNLWKQGKFHLTFLTRSSRIWDCEAYTAETKNQPQDWDVCFANGKII